MSTADLMIKAAKALESGEDPFGASFLSENDVSADQCFLMASQLAIGARMVAAVLRDPHRPNPAALAYAIALAESVT
jgi:hypothetical protein